MKQRPNIFIQFIFLLMLVCTSCVDEPLFESPKDNRLWFTISAVEEGIVNTRADKNSSLDQGITNVFVFLFKTNADNPEAAELLDWKEATPAGTGVGSYYTSLDESVQTGTMYVFANVVSQVWENQIPSADWINENIKTFADVQSLLVPQALLQKEESTDRYLILSNPTAPTMISESQQYTKGEGTLIFRLKRIVAKVTVVDESNNPDYVLQGANAGNAPVAGYAFANAPNKKNIPLGDYAGRNGNSYSKETMICGIADPSAANPTTEPLYIYESEKANMSFVIVQGTYAGIKGYHKLALWKAKSDTDKTKEYLDITRNNQYIIHIKKVYTAGYRTAEEAINNEPANRDIEADIEVTDPSSHDIITNGEQYLGVSNSKLIIYQSGDITINDAFKLSYTVNSKWTSGEITATGNGLSIVSGASGASGATKITLDNTSVEDQSINIKCSSTFKSGTLTIRIGDLVKVLQITRNEDLAAIPEEMVFPDATIGDCSASGDQKYHIAFASKSGMYPSDYHQQGDIFNSGGDTLFTLLAANVGYTNIPERNGEFYVVNAKTEGRTKVIYHQKTLNVDEQKKAQIKPYTYVGTFHRAEQTAERIIRIKALLEDNVTNTWTAMVIAGQDFIELDGGDSNDKGIHKNLPYGYDETEASGDTDNPTFTNDVDIETNCQFSEEQKGKSVIKGTLLPYGKKTTVYSVGYITKQEKYGCIYFRVGMKSKLNSSTSTPRYGLIAVLIRDGIHLIYVRQGEAEDYLMRPQDKIADMSFPRDRAFKVLPYNLIVANTTEKYVDFSGDEKAVLTQYPSQGGYFFQPFSPSEDGSIRAYYPMYKVEGWKRTEQNNAIYYRDVCPKGYRTPTDGADGNTRLVQYSELRQSMWLSPKDGIEQSNFGNMLRGYIADGYYDRRKMRIPNNGSENSDNEGSEIYKEDIVDQYRYPVPTLVGQGAETGYAGMLLYNPNNFASIFVPANGSRFAPMGATMPSSDGHLRGTGAESNIWTSTNRGTAAYYMATGYYANRSGGKTFVFDNYYPGTTTEAFSIRCVKE